MAYGTRVSRPTSSGATTPTSAEAACRPPELLADLVRRYEAIGGLSPLAQRTRGSSGAELQRALGAGEAWPLRGRPRAEARRRASRTASGLALGGTGVEEAVGLVLAPHSGLPRSASASSGRWQAGAAVGVPVAGHPQLGTWQPASPGVPGRAAGAPPAGRPADCDDRPLHRPQPSPERILATGDPYTRKQSCGPLSGQAVAERAGAGGVDMGRIARAVRRAGRAGAVAGAGRPDCHRRPGRPRRQMQDGVLVLRLRVRRRPPRGPVRPDIEAGRAVGRGLAFARPPASTTIGRSATALAGLVADRVAAFRCTSVAGGRTVVVVAAAADHRAGRGGRTSLSSTAEPKPRAVLGRLRPPGREASRPRPSPGSRERRRSGADMFLARTPRGGGAAPVTSASQLDDLVAPASLPAHCPVAWRQLHQLAAGPRARRTGPAWGRWPAPALCRGGARPGPRPSPRYPAAGTGRRRGRHPGPGRPGLLLGDEVLGPPGRAADRRHQRRRPLTA